MALESLQYFSALDFKKPALLLESNKYILSSPPVDSRGIWKKHCLCKFFRFESWAQNLKPISYFIGPMSHFFSVFFKRHPISPGNLNDFCISFQFQDAWKYIEIVQVSWRYMVPFHSLPTMQKLDDNWMRRIIDFLDWMLKSGQRDRHALVVRESHGSQASSPKSFFFLFLISTTQHYLPPFLCWRLLT